MNFVKLTEVDSLLEIDSHKVIESQLIDYIMSLRQDGVSYSTIKYLIAPVFTFYQLNDVLLNKKKVSRYLGEFKRVMKDKAYTTEQIQRALQNADQRMRMIILLLSSTGCRIGADCLVLLEHEKYQRKRMVRLEQGFPYTSLM